MAHSLEARVPFLDHELVELSLRIPAGLKLRGLEEKHILRRAMRDLLPPAIAQRRKFALYTPTPNWLRGPLPDFAAEALSPAALRRKGYFDPATVAELLAQHRRGQGRHAGLLITVLGMQLWDDLFVEGCRPAVGVVR
jgi:asparagine synthase (glutamine-hydrolysing)